MPDPKQHDDEVEPAEPEAPLNRAERRARKKGGPKPDGFAKLPLAGAHKPGREKPARAPRQWAARRTG